MRIYWRHYDSFGQFILILDDILVKSGPEFTTPTVFPNPSKDIIYLDGFKNVLS